MKTLNFILFAVITLSSVALSAPYQDSNDVKFTHDLVKSRIFTTNKYGYLDLKDYQALRFRDIGLKRINGDVEIIGATISVPKNGGYNFTPINYGSLSQTSVGTEIVFVKEDSGYSFNSSKATFNFAKPKNQDNKEIDLKVKGKDIIFARLYWGGGLSNLWSTATGYFDTDFNTMKNRYFNEIKNFNTIKFKTPKGTIHNLTALESDTKWYGYFTPKGMQFMYQANVDVTKIIQDLGDTILNKATFSAGDIKSSDGAPKGIAMYRDNGWLGTYANNNWGNGWAYSGHFGGWSLVVVYDTKDETLAKAKNVSVFDGLHVLDPIHLPSGKTEVIKKTNLKFEGFYTPAYGDIKSSLAVLTFGAKKEVDSEDIRIKKGGSYVSVKDKLSTDALGGNFNSTIAKFGEHMNSGKIYNNQMDLDIYDISSHITNRQTVAEVEMQAKVIVKGSQTLGERANVGLAVFSTDIYVPNVCYTENLLIKGKDDDDSKFQEVGKSEAARSIAKKDSIVRVQLTLTNTANENAEFLSVTTDINPDSLVYVPDTTYINPYSSASAFSLGDKNKDNEKLQKIVGNNLQFYIGNGAKEGSGGTLEKNKKAFIQYDTTLNKAFSENGYKAKFSNKALNLEYDGTIRKCTDYKHYISVFDIADIKIVNNNYKKIGDQETLYTQLAGRNFNIQLAYIDPSLSVGASIKNPTETVKITGLDIATSCASPTSIYNVLSAKKVSGYEFNKSNGLIKIQNISIDDTYPTLFFRATYIDPATNLSLIACSDGFAVRPKEFIPYNISTNSKLTSADLTKLIGGKDYPNIGLVATKNNGNISANYSQILEPDTAKGDMVTFIPVLPSGCSPSKATIDSINADDLRITFTNGKGVMEKFLKNVASASRSYKNFSYPNIGAVVLQVTDNSYTAIDHSNGDCIAGSSDTSGEIIGCNTTATVGFTFVPQDIKIDNFKLANSASGITYMSNSALMSASATFDITARLGDTANSTATLYSNGCYARNVNYTLGLDPVQDIGDYTDATGQVLLTQAERITNASNDIIYFDNTVAGNLLTGGQNQVLATAFTDGVATDTVRINFRRNQTVGKNPFRISSDNFTFSNITNSDSIAGAAYTAPTTVTNADFYYGRAYAPDYTGPTTGFNALVYYGVFCNGCNPITYPLIAGAAALPSNPTWFVNPNHNAAMGTVTAYTPNFPSTAIAVTAPVAAGIENIWLSSNVPNTDRIRMQVPSWLLFNASDPTAITNDFSVTFTGVVRWGGQALDQESNDVGVGSVIGGPNLGTSNRTNKRAEW